MSTGSLARAVLSNRITHWLDATGPSISLDTACSSTVIAIDSACRYLQDRQASGMIVAGGLLYLDPLHLLDPGPLRGAFSPTGYCHTFDAKADGYVRGEAFNAVYLKRLDDAIRDGDPIRAVIRGSSVTSNGRGPGITFPSHEGQAMAIRAAYQNAGISNFNETGYLECHGTGTLAGDPVEVAGAASVFGLSRSIDNPLAIGSIKSNVGHSEPAAGLSGLIKTVLALEKGEIPGTPTFQTPNPRIDFEKSRVIARGKISKWPKSALRRASINSFGFGGTNSHLVLEAPEQYLQSYHKTFVTSYDNSSLINGGPESEQKRPSLLVFSANDPESLKRTVSTLSDHLINPAVDVHLQDLAYTLSERRTRHFHRAFVVTDSVDFLAGTEQTGKARAEPPRIGFIFTGQGAQYSQMGKYLLQSFPAAKQTVESLDRALQTLSCAPQWSLLKELTEKRDAAVLRQPEFSQPLVTALQLALLAALGEWGIEPERVVGHSSGEIATAVAAGLVEPEDAIKIAYLRGLAAKELPPSEPLGMLAVGVSADTVAGYVAAEPATHIACYNSQSSLTISGPVPALEKLRDRLQQDSHFARLLQVDVAYHSKYMNEIAERYRNLLEEHCPASVQQAAKAIMYSSVTASQMGGEHTCGPNYWEANMTNPVRFSKAVSEMISGAKGSEYLIEIGPSNALAGPVSQIIQALPGGSTKTQYTSAAKRGPDTLLALFETAGKLWATGGNVDLTKVNAYDNPKLIVDLPNYQWNKSNRYWHEGLSNIDWLNKPFVTHDLLGAKVLSTPWDNPTFIKYLLVSDLPWLRDHVIGGQVIFPGAAYINMAIEAIFQMTTITEWADEGSPEANQFRYCLKDIKFLRGLFLREDVTTVLTLTLGRVHGSLKQWHRFEIKTQADDTWNTHCEGLVRIDKERLGDSATSSSEMMKPLRYPRPGATAYRDINGMGYYYGPSFQKISSYQWGWGQSLARAELAMEEPPSAFKQSSYPIHPVCLDSLFQLAGFPLWQLQSTSSQNNFLVPGLIESLTIAAPRNRSGKCMAYTQLEYAGLGPKSRSSSYRISGGIYDPIDHSTVLEMKGYRIDELDSRSTRSSEHIYMQVVWDVDLTMTSAVGLNHMLSQAHSTATSMTNGVDENTQLTAGEDMASLQRLLGLVSHKQPTAKILEVNHPSEHARAAGLASSEGVASLWLNGPDADASARKEATFHYVSSAPKAAVEVQDLVSALPNGTLEVADITRNAVDLVASEFDFAIVRLDETSLQRIKAALSNIGRSLVSRGHLVFVSGQSFSSSEERDNIFKELGFSLTRSITLPSGRTAELAEVHQNEGTGSNTRDITVLRFSEQSNSSSIHRAVQDAGWNVQQHDLKNLECKPGSNVLVIDELFHPVASSLSSGQLAVLQDLVQKECNILWVTQGAQMDVTRPEKAASLGLLRVIREEEPHLKILTLDVEESTGPACIHAIDPCLKVLANPKAGPPRDNEFVERNGAIFVPRLIADESLNEAKYEPLNGRPPRTVDLHESDATIRLKAERLGTLEALQYNEAADEKLADDAVEVEIFASGVNFKEVAVTMGIVPGDDDKLGSEGAGIVRRVGASVRDFSAGQRVAVMWLGTYANRIQVPSHAVHAIPDSLPFDAAASLPVAYLTAIYGLFDLGNLQRGQRVLVHLATGGVGNAAIQLCQYMGAEVSIPFH